MQNHEPVVQLVKLERDKDVLRLTIRLSQLITPSFAPASLLSVEPPYQETLILHQCIHYNTDANLAIFETYGPISTSPPIGTRFRFRQWWSTAQLDVVRDSNRVWTRETYPDNGDHDHCLLTWERIEAGSTRAEGYRSGDDWLTIEAYTIYIVGDLLRLRQHV